MKAYSKKRAYQQSQAGSFKYQKLEAGTKLTFIDIIVQTMHEGTDAEYINDYIMCVKPDGKQLKLPVREYMKMTIKDGSERFESEGDNDAVQFPAGITIVSSEGRTDREGRPVFPVHAYNGADDFLADGSEMTWDDLVASDIKSDNKLPQVQNYTVEKN